MRMLRIMDLAVTLVTIRISATIQNTKLDSTEEASSNKFLLRKDNSRIVLETLNKKIEMRH